MAEVVFELDQDGTVVLELGGAYARDLGHLVEPGPGKTDLVGALSRS